jgi:peptidoglycan hydrolase-like protein with peptidoglycan-binding domain
MLPVLFRGNSNDAEKAQASVVAPLEGTNKSNAPPIDIKAAQNRLIELRFLKGPADGVWGTKSRNALRAFKVANDLSADDKWDDLVSGRLYSTKGARSPLPLATTSPAQ